MSPMKMINNPMTTALKIQSVEQCQCIDVMCIILIIIEDHCQYIIF